MAIVEEILQQTNDAIQNFFIDGYNHLVATLHPALTLLLIIFVAIYGFLLIRGTIEMPLRTAIQHLLLALLVYGLISGAGYGAQFFNEVFVEGPAYVASAIVTSQSAGSQASLIQSLSDTFTKGFRAGTHIMANGGWTNWGPYLTGLGVIIVILLFCGYALFLVILAKFALAVLLMLSPLFVPLLLFSRTRGIFEGWLRQVVNFAIVPILVFSVLALMMSMISNYAAQAAAAGSLTSVLPLMLSAVVGMLLLMQVLGIAGGIAGGMSLATMGVVGNAAAKVRGAGAMPGRLNRMRQNHDRRKTDRLNHRTARMRNRMYQTHYDRRGGQ